MTTTDRLVEDYLDRLEGELAGLPRARRRELVDEIEAHIAEGRTHGDSEAQVRTLLDRLGEPSEIADEARDRFGIAPRKRRHMEVGALLLLLPGSLFFVGWLAGVVLLWLSEVWTLRDKLIGTLVVPGGLAVGIFLLISSADLCVDDECSGRGTTFADVLALAYLVAPFVSTAYLAVRLRRARLTA